MSAQEDPLLVACPACGCESNRSSPTCWLCKSDLADAQPLVIAEIIDQRRAEPDINRLFLALTIGCYVFAVLLAVGIYVTDPGGLFGYLIFVLPAILATFGWAAFARLHGKAATGQQLFLTFIGSLAATFVISTLLVVALIISLFVMCMSALR